MADYTRALEVQDGLIVEGGAGVFSGFDSPTFDAPVGSLYLKTDATRYIKVTVGSGGDKWQLDIPTATSANALITNVYNFSGALIEKGSAIYIDGSHGFLPTIQKALATSDATSARTYGVVISDIPDNSSGAVVHSGLLSNIDTFALTEGSQLYLSPTVAGGYTLTKPTAPNHIVFIGVCIRSHPIFGTIEISIQNGYELDELHNVVATAPTNGDVIRYNSSTLTWNSSSTFTTIETAVLDNNGMGARIIPNNGSFLTIGANYESVVTRRMFIYGRLILKGRVSILF